MNANSRIPFRLTKAEAEVLAEMVGFPAESRGVLGLRLGRSKGSVSRIVDRLLSCGAVWEAGRQVAARRGRRTVSLRPRPDLGHLVGADLEGVTARACVMDCERQVLASGRQALDPDWPMARKVKVWTGVIEEVIARAGIDRNRIAGLGVGLPGVVRTDGTRVDLHLPAAREAVFDAGPALRAINLPFTVANNVLCVAEYERRMGLAVRAESFLVVLVRYGIGAAVFTDGHFLVGNGIFTGEIGHMRLDQAGPRCVCGLNGCLDAYASGRTLPPAEKRVGAVWRRELARRGTYLGIGLANLLKLCHVPLIVLNGIYNDFADAFVEPLEAEIRAETAPLGLPPPAVALGEPIEHKASIGAALRAADAFLAGYLLRSG